MAQTSTLEAAMKQAAQKDPWEKFALSAHYDPTNRRVVVSLSKSIQLSFDPAAIQELEKANPADLSDIVISPSGRGLHFPRIDADVFLPGLLMGLTGTKSWMAATLGNIGGRRKSAAKAKSSRQNGLLGGRPKKGISATKAATHKISLGGVRARLKARSKAKSRPAAKRQKRG